MAKIYISIDSVCHS